MSDFNGKIDAMVSIMRNTKEENRSLDNMHDNEQRERSGRRR